MHSQRCYAAVLQHFSYVSYTPAASRFCSLRVPPQTGLYCDRHLDGVHHSLHNLQHERNILQKPGACPLACDFLHWASAIYIYDIGICRFGYARSLSHRLRVTPVYLNRSRTLFVRHEQFLLCTFDTAYQRISRHEFCINHVCAEAFASQAERWVCHILHWSKKQRIVFERNIPDFHT